MDFLDYFGLKKKKPKPVVPTVPSGPLDPSKAYALAERHRDLKKRGLDNQLSLKGTLSGRLQAAIDAVNRDDYVRAEQDLISIENELATELQQYLKAEKEWKERSVTVGDQMIQVLKTVPIERSKMEAFWSFANARVEDPTFTNFEAALKILHDLKELLDNAQPEEIGSVGGVKATGAALAEARMLKSAQVVLAAKTKAAEVALERLRLEFQPALPAALNVQALKLDGLIAPSTETDPVKVENLANSIAAETLKLDELVLAPRAEWAAWKQELAAFELQLATLANHPLKDEATTVKPLLDKINEDLAKAKVDATAMKWTDASAALKLLVPRCETAVQTADGLAHFKTIYQERKNRVDTLPDPGTVPQEPARLAVEATKKLLTDADLEKTAGKYPAAITLLNQIPDAVLNAKKLINAAKVYNGEISKYVGYVAELGRYKDDAKDAIATGLAQFTERVNQAKFPQTNDFVKSMMLLNQANPQYVSLKAKAEQANVYKAALEAFEIRFKEVEDHKGRIAIEEFYARMQTDRTFANIRKLAGEPHIGTTVLDATKPLHAAQIALAVDAENYKTKHKKAGEDIASLKKETNGGKATEVLTEAETRVTAAENAATAKDWPGALKLIESAAVTIEAARKLLADDKELGGLKDTGKLDGIGTDFDAAFGVYQAMRSHVAGKDSGIVFATKLTTADAPAQSARDAAGTQPPNFVLARSELDKAIEVCEATLLLVVKKGAYDTALAGLKTIHTTTLPGLNENNCISPKITEIGQAITGAEQKAATPTFNFDGAQQDIGVTMVKAREAERNATAYKSMKADKQTIKDTLTYLENPARSAGVADEIKRLKDAQTSITNDVNAQKFSNAVKTAAATAKACPGLKKRGELYEKVSTMRKSWVTDRLPLIEGAGKEAAALELAEVKALDTEVEKMMDGHIYELVETFAGKAYHLITAGKKILDDAEAFGTLRATVNTKLNDTLPDRNPSTQERHDGLRDRFDAAVQLASQERNYKRATEMLNTIPGECNGLAADAQAYRDYEDSRKKAGQKLGAAMKDKQAEAVRPMLAQLQSRHTAAVQIASGGDYAPAKKLLDDIFTDAEKTLAAATDARNYAAAAEDMKKPETDIFEAIDKAEEFYKELMAKPESLYAVSTLGGINNKIKTAKENASSNPNGARYGLIEVVDACAQARLLMGHYGQMEASMETLEQEIKAFQTTHAQQAFVKDVVDKLPDEIEAARREARGTGDYAKATKQIQAVDTTFIAQRRAAEAHVPYVARKGEVEAELVKMDKDNARYAIVAAIASVRQDLAQAAIQAAAHDHKAAMALLDKAADTADDALLQAKMHDEAVAPTTVEIKKILAGKDGAKRLDAIIATLDPKAKRKVLDLAFEARFECKLTRFVSKAWETALDEWKKSNPTATPDQIAVAENYYSDQDKEKKGADVQRFYDLMCKLPDTHTKDNDSMQVFLVGEIAEGSDYWSFKKRVAMREGDVATSGIYGLSLPHEIEEVEPGCEIDTGEPITFFNWNTVHEVGHAMDDKLGFMRSKGNSLAGWTSHGTNVRPIAEAVAGKYNYDTAYVSAYMQKATNIPLPEPKIGCDDDEWERRRVACVAWVDSARSDKSPWQSASTAKALAIGGVVYHESYDSGDWSSYNLSARGQGVTGYQFRAPGEWFSELYAAYHTKKMKPSHPAYAWLQTL